MASFFPRAIVYKEWRDQRLWLTIAAAIIVVPAVWAVLAWALFTPIGSTPEMHQLQLANWLSKVVYGQTAQLQPQVHISGNPAPSMTDIFVAIGVAATIVGYERRQGGLLFTLTGPVRKADLLRVKYMLGLFALVVTHVCMLAIATFADMLLGGIITPLVMGAWFLVTLATVILTYSVAFAVLQAVGSAIGGGIITLGVCVVPAVAGGILQVMPRMFDWMQTPNPAWENICHFITRMSPMYYAGTRSELSGTQFPSGAPMDVVFNQNMDFSWQMALVYVVAIYLIYRLAQGLFARARLENLSNVFIFPVLWKWVVFFVSLAVGMLVARATALNTNYDSLFWLRALIFVLVIWMGIIGVQFTYRRLTRREV